MSLAKMIDQYPDRHVKECQQEIREKINWFLRFADGRRIPFWITC